MRWGLRCEKVLNESLRTSDLEGEVVAEVQGLKVTVVLMYPIPNDNSGALVVH